VPPTTGTLLPDGGLLLSDGNVVVPPPVDGGFCAASGPIIPVPGAPSTCSGDLGPRTFLFAVCACSGVAVSGILSTDSLASSGTTTQNGGSIGTNGAFATNSDLVVKGSVWSAGTVDPAVHVVHQGTIVGDVHSLASVQADQPLTIEGSLFSAGDVNGAVTCGGSAHVPSGKSTHSLTADGGIVNEAVSFPAPCDCTNLLDIGSIVASFSSANDDTSQGLTPSSLAPPSGPTTLGCGRYYFDSIDGDDVTLSITARAAIFVAGDLHAHTKLDIELTPGAELDLFVGGNLLLDGDATIGSPDKPARARVYVGGSTFTLTGNAHLGANLYAPKADVQLSSALEMSGSLFVSSLLLSGSFTIHYDESILDSTGCAPSGGSCKSCHDCAGATPACTAGSCAPCTTDGDCCAPLVCRPPGRCIPDIR
jgi:hypothetical protein